MIGTKGILMEKKNDVLHCILFFLFSIPYNLIFFFQILSHILYCCRYGFWKGFCLGVFFDFCSWLALLILKTYIMIC